MSQAKRKLVPGTQFKNPRGVVGTVLAEKSSDGKALARFNCANPSCKRTHARLISDWHQVSRCKFCVAKGVRS